MKKSFLVTFLITLLVLSASFSAGKIFAADAIPEPPVPCSDQDKINNIKSWEDPEFNSQRPYQASPCRDTPYAAMCGNNISVVVDHVSVDWDPAKCSNNTCPYPNQSTQSKRVVINLSGVKLPILGNTQNVANSQTTSDEFDDAQKTNEYAAWYLNGVNQKAEYGQDSNDQIVNFSGPAKKLLPSVIQELNRFATLHYAGVKPDYTDPDTGQTTEETLNHNQIVVCTTNDIDVNILGHHLFSIPWIGKEKPQPCYDGNGKAAKGNVYRLLDWWNAKEVGFDDSKKLLTNWNPYLEWKSAVPPFPWQFSKDVYYQKAYKEWRGEKCLLVPFWEKLFCGDLNNVGIPGTIFTLTQPNMFAQLYQYIPLANTVDKKGKEAYDNVHVAAAKATLIRHQEDTSIDSTLVNKVPRLFYPHTQDVLESTQNLNQTFIPVKGLGNSIGPNTEDNTSTCQILNVRTNPGDDLTFDNTQDQNQIDFTVYYKIKDVKCESKEKTIYNPGTGWTTTTIYNCDSDITASLDLTTLAPNLDDIWKDTVAGNDSTFRKIFPKVEDGAPVSCIADIPGVSQANYTLVSPSDPSVKDLNVKNPGGSTVSTPQIYFPHLGGVYEYFLKGIQTALRPQGYGDPIVNGTQCGGTATCGQLPTFPRASGSCALGSISRSIGSIPNSLKDIINSAADAFKTPPNLILAQMYGEGLFNPGRFKWNDSNVKSWATCTKVPGCQETGDDHFMGFNGDTFKKIAASPAYVSVMKKIDPTRAKYDQCNLMDTIFATSYNLHMSSAGGGGMPSRCFNVALGGIGIKNSCDWDPPQYAAAIQAAENGYQPGCFTAIGSCLTGGGTNALCPSGGDTCEWIDRRFPKRPSHFGCFWDVAHGN